MPLYCLRFEDSMDVGTGGSAVCKNLLLFPAVSIHTNVITLSVSCIGYCSFLLDEALSSKYLILGKIHLHLVFKILAYVL